MPLTSSSNKTPSFKISPSNTKSTSLPTVSSPYTKVVLSLDLTPSSTRTLKWSTSINIVSNYSFTSKVEGPFTCGIMPSGEIKTFNRITVLAVQSGDFHQSTVWLGSSVPTIQTVDLFHRHWMSTINGQPQWTDGNTIRENHSQHRCHPTVRWFRLQRRSHSYIRQV